MVIYLSGIGGVGIGPLAEIAHDAGYEVTGSDIAESLMTNQLREIGIEFDLSQDGNFIKSTHEDKHIDWFVHTAALPNNHPELVYAKENGIKVAKRDELLSFIVREKNMKLIGVSGTHGKTTTTGMMIWALKQLNIPISYSIGTTISFGPSGKFDPASRYFIYECDEFDRNMLHFEPYLSLITSIGYDHVDTYPEPKEYNAAFGQFINQSSHTIGWQRDINKCGEFSPEKVWQLQDEEVIDVELPGEHNRRNATLVLKALEYLASRTTESDLDGFVQSEANEIIESFPGTNRRFEKLADNLYTDYGHHPAEITATLQMASEISSNVVLVYQPHQNVRQHEVKSQYESCFYKAQNVYWLPTYLSREESDLEILSPSQVSESVINKEVIEYAELNDELWHNIEIHRKQGHLVLCMGAGSIDGWLRKQLQVTT